MARETLASLREQIAQLRREKHVLEDRLSEHEALVKIEGPDNDNEFEIYLNDEELSWGGTTFFKLITMRRLKEALIAREDI